MTDIKLASPELPGFLLLQSSHQEIRAAIRFAELTTKLRLRLVCRNIANVTVSVTAADAESPRFNWHELDDEGSPCAVMMPDGDFGVRSSPLLAWHEPCEVLNLRLQSGTNTDASARWLFLSGEATPADGNKTTLGILPLSNGNSTEPDYRHSMQ